MPLVSSKHEVTEDDRQSLMMSITAQLPDHNARLQALQVDSSLVFIKIVTFATALMLLLLLLCYLWTACCISLFLCNNNNDNNNRQ